MVLPQDANQLQVNPVPMQSNMIGFSKTDFGGITFDLPNKYQAIKLIGKGTYGSVISARNTESNEQVAIKKLSSIEDVVSELSNLCWGKPNTSCSNLT